MFLRSDLKVESFSEITSLILMIPFLVLVMPFLGAVWTLGFFEDLVGWLDT